MQNPKVSSENWFTLTNQNPGQYSVHVNLTYSLKHQYNSLRECERDIEIDWNVDKR